MLVAKQQALHAAQADAAAQRLLLERQLAAAQQQLARFSSGASSGASSSAGVAYPGRPALATDPEHGGSVGYRAAAEVIPMDALGEPYQRLARHRKVGKAVQATAGFLDRTAAMALTLLRQYPLARLALLAYAVAGHLLFYVLIHRMQHQAMRLQHTLDDLASHHNAAGAAGDAGSALHHFAG